MSDKKNLRAFVAPKKMLIRFDEAGVGLGNLFFPGKMEGILSELDFKKYNNQTWMNDVVLGGTGPSAGLSGIDIDDIRYFNELMSDHYNGVTEDCAFDKDILSDSYEGGIITYPVLYKKQNNNDLFIYLVQLKDSMTKECRKGWWGFYESLLQNGVPIQELCKYSSFNDYINMTNGVTSEV